MKVMYEFVAIMLIIFGFCFAISTLGYSVIDPSLPEIKVVRYGFPMTWLKRIVHIVDSAPTQYVILWTELLIDIVFYSVLSSVVSFIIIKAMRQREVPTKVP